MDIKIKRNNTSPIWLLTVLSQIRGSVETSNTSDPSTQWQELQNVVNSALDDMVIWVRNCQYSGSSVKREFDEATRSAIIYTSTNKRVAAVITINPEDYANNAEA